MVTKTPILTNTVTSFLTSKTGKQLTSKRVLFHLPKRLFGYNLENQTIVQSSINPISVALCPTSFCVRQCNFCSNTTRNAEGRAIGAQYSSKAFDEINEDLNQMKVMGVTIAGGGEPLVYDKPEFISFLAQQSPPFKIGIHTNGVLMRKVLIPRVIESRNVRYINISVVAHEPDLYHRITGADTQQFFEIENGLMKSVELQDRYQYFPEFGVKIIICRNNYRYVKDMVRYFQDLGITNILIRCVGNFEPGQDVELLETQYDELSSIFSVTFDRHRTNRTIKIWIRPIPLYAGGANLDTPVCG